MDIRSLEQLAGRTLMVGLAGPTLDAETRDRLARIGPGGVILFDRNLESADQTVELLAEIRRTLPHPPLLAIDQEGGRVSRLARWIGPTRSAAELGRDGAGAVRNAAHATGRALRAMGFNLDFAPVVDLCEAEATNGIADRSFGTEPDDVVRLAGAFLDGLQEQGIAGCLKHFPGLGDTSVDSHLELPSCRRERRLLLELDLAPYRRLADRAATVMVGHGHYPTLCTPPNPLNPESLPATLCPEIVQGLLRGELGYGGLVVSDDMEMGAVKPLDHDGDAAARALSAGCDLLLYCHELERAEQAVGALVRQARRDEAGLRRLEQAAAAVDATARRWSENRRPGETAQAALAELRYKLNA